eukprot:scaffold5892_cov112-Isochrysis_galbana.AAC.13
MASNDSTARSKSRPLASAITPSSGAGGLCGGSSRSVRTLSLSGALCIRSRSNMPFMLRAYDSFTSAMSGATEPERARASAPEAGMRLAGTARSISRSICASDRVYTSVVGMLRT